MATFYYSPNQTPPAPPAYIQPAAASVGASKWYDPNRSWGEYLQELIGYGKKPNAGDNSNQPKPSTLDPQQPALSAVDNFYDHAFPFGTDPNDSSKPYAPHGFYCDANGNPTTPNVDLEKQVLERELLFHPDPTDPKSPLNPYNIESPMDPNNMQQFFYADKPGIAWSQYTRTPDQEAPWYVELKPVPEMGYYAMEYPGYQIGSLGDYVKYPNQDILFKKTSENFPWSYDQDPSHHFRIDTSHGIKNSTGSTAFFTGPAIDFNDPNWNQDKQVAIPSPFRADQKIEKIYLDSPFAPAGWTAVGSDTTSAGNSAAE